MTDLILSATNHDSLCPLNATDDEVARACHLDIFKVPNSVGIVVKVEKAIQDSGALGHSFRVQVVSQVAHDLFMRWACSSFPHIKAD